MGYTTSELVDRLGAEGFQITAGYLSYLLRECPVLKPESRVSSLYLWQPADVERLKGALKDRHRGPPPLITHKEAVHRIQALSAVLGQNLLVDRNPKAVPLDELRAIIGQVRL
jgi:hypothetical protein